MHLYVYVCMHDTQINYACSIYAYEKTTLHFVRIFISSVSGQIMYMRGRFHMHQWFMLSCHRVMSLMQPYSIDHTNVFVGNI